MKARKIIAGMALAALSMPALAETAPSFPGGKEAMDEFIAKTLVYPTPALENGVEGVVAVSFTVNEDGTIGSIKIVRMIDPDLEQEAIRIVKKMPEWIPAEEDGVAVASNAQIDINFELPGE